MRKRFFKFLFIFALLFGFATILASCNKNKEPDNSQTEQEEEKKDNEPEQKETQPSNQLLVLPDDYYEKLLTTKDNVVISIEDASFEILGDKINIENDSYIKLAIKDDTLVANAYINFTNTSDSEAESTKLYISLDNEGAILRRVDINNPNFLSEVYLTDTEYETDNDFYDEDILYKEITLSKEYVTGLVNSYLAQMFGEDEEESTATVELPTISKKEVASYLETIMSLVIEYTFGEDVVTGKLSYTKLRTINEILYTTKVSTLIDLTIGAGTFETVKALFDSEAENNVDTMLDALTVGDLFDMIKEENPNFTPADIDTLVQTIAAADFDALSTIPYAVIVKALLSNPSTIASMLVYYLGLDPTTLPAELTTKIANGTITIGDVLSLEQVQAMTIKDVINSVYSKIKDEDDAELDLCPIVTPILALLEENTIYQLIALKPAKDGEEPQTAEGIYNEVNAGIDELEDMLKIQFVTDNNANVKNVVVELDSKIAKGKLTFDFTKTYSDTLNEELKPYIPYASESDDESTKVFEEIMNDHIFDDITDYEIIKENDKYVGFKEEDEQTTTTYKFGKTGDFDDYELESSKKHIYGNYWLYYVGVYSEKVAKNTEGATPEKAEKEFKFYYNSETKKLSEKLPHEYEKVSTSGEGTCDDPVVEKYVDKNNVNDYYYVIDYIGHTFESARAVKKTTRYGREYYNIYITCSECEKEYLYDRDYYYDGTIEISIKIEGLDIEATYDVENQKVTEYEANQSGDDYIFNNSLLEGLDVKSSVAYEYENCKMIYIRVGEDGYDGIIVLNADGTIKTRLGTAVIAQA